MKKFRPLLLFIITLGVMSASPAFSQVQCNLLEANNASAASHSYMTGYWFGIMERPFLFIAVFFAFLTAYALNGGTFNVFKSVFGQLSGSIAWFTALIFTWGLSGLGFYSIYKASKGA